MENGFRLDYSNLDYDLKKSSWLLEKKEIEASVRYDSASFQTDIGFAVRCIQDAAQ